MYLSVYLSAKRHLKLKTAQSPQFLTLLTWGRNSAHFFDILYILTWTCASLQSGVHFYISASKKHSRPSRPQVFCAFWSGHVLSRRTRALFDISTSKSGLDLRCFVHFELDTCFAPPRRAIFSSLIWPAGSAPAALASVLFDPPDPQIVGETQCWRFSLPFRATQFCADFPTFSYTCIFFLLTFSDLPFSSLLRLSLLTFFPAFHHLSILSEV